MRAHADKWLRCFAILHDQALRENYFERREGKIAEKIRPLLNAETSLSDGQQAFVAKEIRKLARWWLPWGYKTRFLLLLTFVNSCRAQ